MAIFTFGMKVFHGCCPLLSRVHRFRSMERLIQSKQLFCGSNHYQSFVAIPLNKTNNLHVSSARLKELYSIHLIRKYSSSRFAGFSQSNSTNDEDVDHHDYQIRMPQINDENEGTVDQWMKKAGDSFVNGERLCIVSLGDLTVAVNAIRDGVISEIRLPVGHKGKVTKPIAIFVQNQKEYMSFLEEERQESLEAAKMAEAKSAGSDKGEEKKVDSKDLMRAVRHLIQTGMLDGESDVAKKMQGLARKSNPEMLSIFEASTDDGNYKPETFDYKFFLENATDVVKEQKEAL